jgi:hypothetical protein
MTRKIVSSNQRKKVGALARFPKTYYTHNHIEHFYRKIYYGYSTSTPLQESF